MPKLNLNNLSDKESAELEVGALRETLKTAQRLGGIVMVNSTFVVQMYPRPGTMSGGSNYQASAIGFTADEDDADFDDDEDLKVGGTE